MRETSCVKPRTRYAQSGDVSIAYQILDGNGSIDVVFANGFIGKQVTATDASGSTLTGVVGKVTYTAMGPLLNVGGSDVPIEDITQAANAPGNGTLA